jgi:hypothetical protein
MTIGGGAPAARSVMRSLAVDEARSMVHTRRACIGARGERVATHTGAGHDRAASGSSTDEPQPCCSDESLDRQVARR